VTPVMAINTSGRPRVRHGRSGPGDELGVRRRSTTSEGKGARVSPLKPANGRGANSSTSSTRRSLSQGKIETSKRMCGRAGVHSTPRGRSTLTSATVSGRLRCGIAKTHLLDLLGPDAQGAPTGCAAGARGSRLGRRGLHLPHLGGHAHQPGLPSTPAAARIDMTIRRDVGFPRRAGIDGNSYGEPDGRGPLAAAGLVRTRPGFNERRQPHASFTSGASSAREFQPACFCSALRPWVIGTALAQTMAPRDRPPQPGRARLVLPRLASVSVVLLSWRIGIPDEHDPGARWRNAGWVSASGERAHPLRAWPDPAWDAHLGLGVGARARLYVGVPASWEAGLTHQSSIWRDSSSQSRDPSLCLRPTTWRRHRLIAVRMCFRSRQLWSSQDLAIIGAFILFFVGAIFEDRGSLGHRVWSVKVRPMQRSPTAGIRPAWSRIWRSRSSVSMTDMMAIVGVRRRAAAPRFAGDSQGNGAAGVTLPLRGVAACCTC